jgi:hypothetical protein
MKILSDRGGSELGDNFAGSVATRIARSFAARPLLAHSENLVPIA